MRKTAVMLTAVMTAFVLAGCGSVNIFINKGEETEAAEPAETAEQTEAAEPAEQLSQDRVYSAGPYGRIGVVVPDGWDYTVCPLDSEFMSYGNYGFMMHPRDEKEGVIAIFCARGFAVCGTNLKQEETEISGKKARIGTYDDHDRWDFIVIGEEDPQIVVTNAVCDSWTDAEWAKTQEVIDSINLDGSVKCGAVWQYTPGSEDTEAGVSMDLSNITQTGAKIHFYRYNTGDTEELSYGESYILEKENDGVWEEVPVVTENAAFTEIAYIIPENESSEIETDWEWLYGPLSEGTYRIKKTVTERTGDTTKDHELTAQFLIAGPSIKNTVNSDFCTYYEMSDGTWMYDGYYYKYRLEITGRMNNAAVDSTFVYLSNTEDISFERAIMASGLSSNLKDYFKPEEAVFVGWID